MNDDSNWISAREAQQRLGRGERQLRNYAKQGRLRNRMHGRRLEYYEPDVADLAGTLPEDDRQRVVEQSVMPAGEMLNHIRELERQLGEAMAQVGYLRGQLDTQQLQLTEAKQAQRLLVDKEREAAELERALNRATSRNKRSNWVIIGLVIIIVLVVVFFAYSLGIAGRQLPAFR